MSDVFISYKAEDRARIAPLVQALEADGVSVWWDQHIGGGSEWRREIEEHLEAARCVIVAWSERTLGPVGRFVRDEAGVAQESGRYLPITIDEVRPPLGFREVQAIDLVGWRGNADDPRYQALLAALRSRLDGTPVPVIAARPVERGPVVSRRAVLAGAGGVMAAATGVYLLVKPGAAEARRIAILPFSNLSSGTQDYFADGLTEELRGALSRAGLKSSAAPVPRRCPRKRPRTSCGSLASAIS